MKPLGEGEKVRHLGTPFLVALAVPEIRVPLPLPWQILFSEPPLERRWLVKVAVPAGVSFWRVRHLGREVKRFIFEKLSQM